MVNVKISSFFPIKNGVRQGCAAALELFNCIINYILNETHRVHPFNISYARRTLSDTTFTVDVATLSDNLEKLKCALETLSATISVVGLQIFWKKTKTISIEKTFSTAPLTVQINGQAVVLARQFTYLRSIISSNGTLTLKSLPDQPRQILCLDDSRGQFSSNQN